MSAPDPHDVDVRAAILASDAPSICEIAAELLARFGAERAWPVEWVMDEISAGRGGRLGRKDAYAFDADIMAFIEDRAELVAVAEIARLGAAAFAPRPFPSASQVHRYVQRFRQERLERRARRIKRASATLP